MSGWCVSEQSALLIGPEWRGSSVSSVFTRTRCKSIQMVCSPARCYRVVVMARRCCDDSPRGKASICGSVIGRHVSLNGNSSLMSLMIVPRLRQVRRVRSIIPCCRNCKSQHCEESHFSPTTTPPPFPLSGPLPPPPHTTYNTSARFATRSPRSLLPGQHERATAKSLRHLRETIRRRALAKACA